MAGKRETLPQEGERAGLKALSAAMASHLENAVGDAQLAQARLAERNRLGAMFIRNLAHDLSTPITPIAGYLKILASEKMGALTPQQLKVLESIQSSVARLTRIVDNLADFASLQSGESALFLGEVEPDALAEAVVADLRPAIREARLHVSVAKPGGGPVKADPRKLRQELANLVSNAVKFSPHGGEVLVEVTRDAGRLRKWHRAYLEALIERDARDVSKLRNLDHPASLLRLLAHQNAGLLNVNSAAKLLGIRRETVENNLSALERLFLIRFWSISGGVQSRR